MSNIHAITRAKFVSGEMFDLTAASFNNDFGAEHNKCVIKHGINFPLSKFITELTMIMATTTDDKTIKRANRLAFLLSCDSSSEVQELFSLFANFLNGGGTDSSRTNWAMQQYYDNFMVITAAGGNIIILFAQLLANMIDVFKCKVNADYDRSYDGSAADDWDINDPNYEAHDFETDGAYDIAQSMFSTNFGRWSKNYWDIINDTFASLTRTNKIILEGLQNVLGNFSKEQLCFIIVKHFIQLDETDSTTLQNLWNVALSEISDFDFKLSPNIHPSLSGDPDADPVDALTSAFAGLGVGSDGEVSSLIGELFSNIKPDDSGGFLLFRVKTLIDCSTDYKQQYTAKQLKTFQRDCASRLGNWIWGLYPQIMQQSYLNDVPHTSKCWIFLNHLNEKKQAIREATQNSIDETMKFHLAGYFKQANSLGETFAMVNQAPNSTEAIIDYISNITYHMNIYIETWETINPRKEHILSSKGAPALHEGGLPARFSHKSVCYNFLSLDSILKVDDGLVARLCGDIINYFLNNNPYFNTETILDNLIKSFNTKRAKLTGRRSKCFMPPSDLLAVPTNANFNGPLRFIKQILDGTRYSELGFPDGVRITLNAIETKDLIGDTHLDAVELAAQISVNGDTSIQSGYTPLGKGLKKRLRVKKVKTQRQTQRQTQRRKQQKQKSLKPKRQKNRKVTLKRKLKAK